VWAEGAAIGLLDTNVFRVGFVTMALGWFRDCCPFDIVGYGIFVAEDCVESMRGELPTARAVMLSLLDCCAKFPAQWIPEGCIGADVTGTLEEIIVGDVAWGARGLVDEVLRAFRVDCLSADVLCTDECTDAAVSS
jgi:hypothetical protein